MTMSHYENLKIDYIDIKMTKFNEIFVYNIY